MTTDTANIEITKAIPTAKINGRDFPLESKVYKPDGEAKVFSIFKLDDPEKWVAAVDCKSEVIVTIPGSTQVVTVPLNAISFKQWQATEVQFPFDDDEDTKDIAKRRDAEQKREAVEESRKVRVLEFGTGQTIPGETEEEKKAWLRKLPHNYINAINDHLLGPGSNLNPPRTEPEIILLENCISSAPVAMGGLETWNRIFDIGTSFRFKRISDAFITEIPIRLVSEEVKMKVRNETPAPIPPSRPGRNAAGQISMDSPVYDFENKQYIKAEADNEMHRTVLMFEAALFPLPGETIPEKMEWLSNRPLGDVLQVKAFLRDKVFGYQGGLQYFL